jgi:hypothetical protein
VGGKDKVEQSVEGEKLTLKGKKKEREKMHTRTKSSPPNEIQEQKERREERERERGEFGWPRVCWFSDWRKCRGETGAVTWELLFAEWGNFWWRVTMTWQ